MEERLKPRVQEKNKLQAEMSKNVFCMWKETAKKNIPKPRSSAVKDGSSSPPLPVALRPNAGHGLLILEVSRSHTQRRTTVGRTPLDE
jgi:hypothetical protein